MQKEQTTSVNFFFLFLIDKFKLFIFKHLYEMVLSLFWCQKYTIEKQYSTLSKHNE